MAASATKQVSPKPENIPYWEDVPGPPSLEKSTYTTNSPHFQKVKEVFQARMNLDLLPKLKSPNQKEASLITSRYDRVLTWHSKLFADEGAGWCSIFLYVVLCWLWIPRLLSRANSKAIEFEDVDHPCNHPQRVSLSEVNSEVNTARSVFETACKEVAGQIYKTGVADYSIYEDFRYNYLYNQSKYSKRVYQEFERVSMNIIHSLIGQNGNYANELMDTYREVQYKFLEEMLSLYLVDYIKYFTDKLRCIVNRDDLQVMLKNVINDCCDESSLKGTPEHQKRVDEIVNNILDRASIH